MFVLFYAASPPFFSEAALKSLEPSSALTGFPKGQAGAVVVLGGGTFFKAPEYAHDTVSAMTLERLRYAAHLHRQTGILVLVSGGAPQGNAVSEARQMQTALSEDFRVPVQWLEEGSGNTVENARYSREMLRRAGVDTIYLVTHAWHMKRAQMAFERSGFKVIAAPTGFTTRYRTTLLAFIPGADGLVAGRRFLHEVIGILWYRLRLSVEELIRKGSA